MRNLRTDIELFAAALAQARVMVTEPDGSIADYGGPVEKYTAAFVKVAGTYYARSEYIFQTEVRR